MLRIEKVRANDGAGNAVLDIQVSTVAELPALDEELGMRLTVKAGSIAQVIQTGAWYTLDANGTWYDTSGNAASSASNNSLSMSPTLNKAIAGSTDDTIGLTEDDIDRISDELEKTEEPDVKGTDKIEKSVLYPEEQSDLKKSEPTESEVTEDA